MGREAFPYRAPGEGPKILRESRESLLGWLGRRLFSMLVVGALSVIALYVIGVPAALFLGILSGLVAFVPIIGFVVAGVLLDELWFRHLEGKETSGSSE